jgi:hypothetical protein
MLMAADFSLTDAQTAHHIEIGINKQLLSLLVSATVFTYSPVLASV